MFQFSLRSALVLVALIALAIVSLRFASPAWRTLVLGIDFVVVWAAAIVAFVDRGPRQAFAIGCALSIVIYEVLLIAMPLEGSGQWRRNLEFNPDTGRLATTKLLGPLFRAVAEVRYIDMSTGQAVSEAEMQQTRAASPIGSASFSLNETPDRSTFMAIGHSWWALLLGFVGGWFARLVYQRRMSRSKS